MISEGWDVLLSVGDDDPGQSAAEPVIVLKIIHCRQSRANHRGFLLTTFWSKSQEGIKKEDKHSTVGELKELTG